MADDIDISLDPAGYLAGVNQIDQANQRLQRSFGGVATGSAGMQKAISFITPGRAAIAGMTVFAAQAAKSQQGLSNLQATATVTEVRVDKLSGSIKKMARDMPLGYEASKQLVEQVTKMGVASKGSEKQIAALATTTSKLSGATGENASSLATGMIELSRATGSSNLDPKRFERLSDSLTTVAAKSGASATSVLQFSKAIAPMAQASGIGATGILGISSAFAKLGEDGFGASTAVTKMLTDMNRSVREGSPEIRTYATIVGKSADEFERLFKANPAEAVTQVTEALAKSGNAPRMLEQIGIEGVRGQRAIQALVSSGGLRESISTAVGAYGSGSTEKASEAAFGGLNDSLSQASESATQVAEAFGSPLLGPLTKFTDLITGITNTVGAVAGSGVGQGALTAVAYGGIATVFAKAVMGPLGIAALTRQAATSSPLRTAAAAITNVTGSTGWLSRFGAPANVARAEGRMGPRNTSWFNRVTGLAEDWQTRNPPGGLSTLQRIRTAAGAYGGNLLQTYMGSVGQGYANAAMKDPFNRKDSLRASEGFQKAWAAAQSVDTTGMSQWQVLRTGMSEFNKELKATTGSTAGLRQQFGGFAKMVGQMGGFGVRLGADATAGVRGVAKKAVSGAADFIGVGGAISAAMAVGAYGIANTAQQREENAAFANTDIAGTLNQYRDSIGKATETTKTFGQVNQDIADQLSKRSQVLGFEETKTITEADKQAAIDNNTVTRKYYGDAGQVAGQIAGINPMGLAPDELQAVKVDLLRQFTPEVTSSILGQLKAPSSGTTGGPPQPEGFGPQQITAAVQGIATSGRGWMDPNFGPGADWSSLEGGSPFGPGQAFYQNPMDENNLKAVQGVAEGIGQSASKRSALGSPYALQEQIKDMNTALKAAADANDVTGFNELSKRFGVMLGGQDVKDVTWSGLAFRDRGYEFSEDVASQSPAFKARRDALLGAGGRLNGPGGIAPQIQQNINYENVRPQSQFLAGLFDAKGSNPMVRAMTASLGNAENVPLQQNVTQETIRSAKNAGISMADLAVQAAKAGGALSEASDEFARVKAVQQRAEQQMAYEQQGMTPGQQLTAQYEYHTAAAAITPQTKAQAQEVEGHKAAAAELEMSMRQRFVARLEMERQYNTASLRAHQDLNLQKEYSDADYTKASERMNRDFNTQETISRKANQLQQDRAEEDFAKTRRRAYRDLHKNQLRAEDAFQTQRARQQRDYNKQLARSIEDAASTMYDPYKRIQTQATWDAKNLMGNLAEQTEAMNKQKSQLDQLRAMGLSAQAIDVLGLGKAENAQQVNNLIADAGTDPAVIAQLTASAAAQAKAAAALFTDESNKEIRRGKEDLQTSFADQRKDLNKQLGYQNQDLEVSLGDAEKDMRNSFTRMNADLTTSLTNAKKAMNVSLGDMATDRDISMTRSRTALNTQLKRMKDDIKNADLVISGTLTDLAEATDAAIHGKVVHWERLLTNDTTTWLTDFNTRIKPLLGQAMGSFGINGAGAANAGSSASADRAISDRASEGSASVRSGIRHADGGPVQGYSVHEKADNIPAWLTGGEFVQNVHAVRKYGTDAMHAINNRSVPKEVLLEAIRGFATGGFVRPVPGRVLFPYGHYPSGGIHRALDFYAKTGTPVHAPYSGEIRYAGWDTTGYGNVVRINDSDGNFTILGHNSSLLVRTGEKVNAGRVVAFSGYTGNVHPAGPGGAHVHWSRRRSPYDDSTAFNPMGSGEGIISASTAAELVAGVPLNRASAAQVNALFAKMDNKPGPYNQLTEHAKGLAMKALGYDQGGLMPTGGGGFVNGTGKPEKVLTDSQWGAVSQLAGRGGMSMNDLRGVHTAAGVHITVNNTGAVTYDHRNDFSGAAIVVQAQDPNEMARKLEAKAIRARLTSTRGVRVGA